MSYLSDPTLETVSWLQQDSGFRNSLVETCQCMTDEERKHFRIDFGQTHYEPFEHARIVARGATSSGNGAISDRGLNMLIEVFADRARAEEEYKWSKCQEAVPGIRASVHFIPERHIVVWTIPNAPKLNNGAAVLSAEGSAVLLPKRNTSNMRLKLTRYVPKRSALAVWEDNSGGESYFVKVMDDADTVGPGAAALNLRELNAWQLHGAFDFDIPRLVRFSPDRNTIVTSALQGRPFSEFMRALKSMPFERVGKSLASLHALSIVPVCELSDQKVLNKLRRKLAGVSRALPEMEQRIDAVLLRLEHRCRSLQPSTNTPIHGNFSGDAVLLNRDADDKQVGILDWDRFGWGDPHHDLGGFVAYALHAARVHGLCEPDVGRCLHAFLHSYESKTNRSVDWQRLEWQVAVHLLLRTHASSLQKLAADWPRHFEYAVSRVERYLHGGNLLLSDTREHSPQHQTSCPL